MTEEALELYLNRAVHENTDEKEISALRSLINNLDEKKIPQKRWIEIVKDDKVASIIRFSIAVRISSLVEDELKVLYEEIKNEWLEFGKDYYINAYEFKNCFWLMPECEFFELVKRKSLNDEQIAELLDSLFSLKIEDKFLDRLLGLYASDFLSEDIKFKLNLLLSSKDTFYDQIYAVEQLSTQNIDNITLWCFLIGHIDKEVALKGLEQLSKRTLTNEEYINILSSLNTGLNYIMEPTVVYGGVLYNKSFHPALPEFVSWLLEEFPKYEFTDVDYIKVLDNISQISSEKINDDIEEILDKIASNWVPVSDDVYDEEDDKIQWTIISGLRLCEREKIQLSEEVLMKILQLKKFNLIRDSLNHLRKIANLDTTQKLIDFHNSLVDSSMRGMLVDCVEKISNRIGFKVVNNHRNLQIT